MYSSMNITMPYTQKGCVLQLLFYTISDSFLLCIKGHNEYDTSEMRTWHGDEINNRLCRK